MIRTAFILLLLIPTTSSGAFGVSEKSVKKWSFTKLCERRARYDAEEDYRAVAIIVNELAQRDDVDILICDRIGEKWLRESGSKQRRKHTVPLEDEQAEIYQLAKIRTLSKFGPTMIAASLDAACDKKWPEIDIEGIRNHAAGFVPSKKYPNLLSILSNTWRSMLEGHYLAFREAVHMAPGLCKQENRDIIRTNAALRY